MKPHVYLDNAATTPVRPEVREVIAQFLSGDHFGNPSSSHRIGRTARAAVEGARKQVATVLGTEPDSVVFTSGGTEADNLAVLGAALAARSRGDAMTVAVSAVEHKAVLDAANAVKRMGGKEVVLGVDEAGAVIPGELEAALSERPSVVSVMWVNNETGAVQNIAELADLCVSSGALFHTDAVQAVGKVACSLADIPGTMLTISGHKIGAPKGIGALVLPAGQTVEPLIHGGGQQGGIRPGTENVIGIVALGVAVELAVAELAETSIRTSRLRNDLEQRVLAFVPDARVNGATGTRAPHISNISFPDAPSDALTMHLDLANVYCSTGSACHTGVASPSHVLSAMGVSNDLARAAVRFSFSHDSDEADVDSVMEVLPDIVQRVRELVRGSQ
jgi:cysteine desulfurase